MVDTVREHVDTRRHPVVPVLVHVLGCDELLQPPRGLWPLDARLVVGRGPGASLEVADGRVSSRHLALERHAGATIARDLGSANGTVLNGRPLHGDAPLADRDVLQVGRTFLEYRELPALPPADGWPWGEGRSQCHEVGALGAKLDVAAPSLEPVMLLGETGVGKELAARRLHRLSGRTGPLVAIDCGAVPHGLAESLLFGHEKGAFTGATEAHVGELVRGHRGTVFLDELGNLPVETQVKLLRVVETRLARPVRGREVELDVRWVSATSPAQSERLRSDLHFRLAGVVLRVPPLRARREDLGLLLRELLVEAGAHEAFIHPRAAWTLFTHPLPGNVRQLRQLVRSATVLADGGRVILDEAALAELALPRAPSSPEDQPSIEARPAPGARPVVAPSRGELEVALRDAAGNVAAAARALRTSPRQLYRWLERAGVDPDGFRGAGS